MEIEFLGDFLPLSNILSLVDSPSIGTPSLGIPSFLLQLSQARSPQSLRPQSSPSQSALLRDPLLLLAPPLHPSDNLLHISDFIDSSLLAKDVDIKLEVEIEHYMAHLAEEQELSASPLLQFFQVLKNPLCHKLALPSSLSQILRSPLQ